MTCGLLLMITWPRASGAMPLSRSDSSTTPMPITIVLLCLYVGLLCLCPITHPDFAVAIVSSAFAGKTQIARHRQVNSLLKDEFDNQGLHALSLRLKTPEEWEGEIAKAQAQ